MLLGTICLAKACSLSLSLLMVQLRIPFKCALITRKHLTNGEETSHLKELLMMMRNLSQSSFRESFFWTVCLSALHTL
uniref:Cytosolic endo-beta-N-acetylglucosaminidase-like n=1 Tax=Rhizophora mucronata TaxID=61149 RepID=A0A2P2KK65_RHIMU